MPQDKIARICWNTEGWRQPSGPQGKSKNKRAYERRVGYGHEEWLLDTTKLIDGWYYAYLQPVGLHRQKYVGQTFNVSLYSINDETKQRWWVGRIPNVMVIPLEESERVYLAYKLNGWLREMEQQLNAAHADTRDFRAIDPFGLFVIKYQPENLQLLDIPLEFASDDPAVPASYDVLLNQKQVPHLLTDTNRFEFSPGHNGKKSSAKATYQAHSSDIDLVHNNIHAELYDRFCKKYGEENVGTEHDTGHGAQVDVVVRDSDNKHIFYEIKTSYSVRLCVREAIGQLLEYAFYPKTDSAKKLIIVSPNPITQDVATYLRQIRDRFNLPIYYQRFDSEKKALEDVEY